jgi:hypothetical protein
MSSAPKVIDARGKKKFVLKLFKCVRYRLQRVVHILTIVLYRHSVCKVKLLSSGGFQKLDVHSAHLDIAKLSQPYFEVLP